MRRLAERASELWEFSERREFAVENMLRKQRKKFRRGAASFHQGLCPSVFILVDDFLFCHLENPPLGDGKATDIADGVSQKVPFGYLPGDVDVPPPLCLPKDEVVEPLRQGGRFQPADGTDAEADRPRKLSLEDSQIDRASRQADPEFDLWKAKDGMRHL